MDNDHIEFSARFGGVARSLYVPMAAVMAIYAKENGKGMFFEAEEPNPPDPVSPETTTPTLTSKAGGKGRASLKVVK